METHSLRIWEMHPAAKVGPGDFRTKTGPSASWWVYLVWHTLTEFMQLLRAEHPSNVVNGKSMATLFVEARYGFSQH